MKDLCTRAMYEKECRELRVRPYSDEQILCWAEEHFHNQDLVCHTPYRGFSYTRNQPACELDMKRLEQIVQRNQVILLSTLDKVAKQIKKDHQKEGVCRHSFYCEIVAPLLEFLSSPQGKKTLRELAHSKWEEINVRCTLVESGLCASRIHKDELSAFKEMLVARKCDHALVKGKMGDPWDKYRWEERMEAMRKNHGLSTLSYYVIS